MSLTVSPLFLYFKDLLHVDKAPANSLLIVFTFTQRVKEMNARTTDAKQGVGSSASPFQNNVAIVRRNSKWTAMV
jgi:hypothetical protein